MEKILWFLGGLVHSLLHPDSSFVTLLAGGHNRFGAVLFIILSNSIWMVALYHLNKMGLLFSLKRSKKLSAKMKEWSSDIVRKFGYIGLIALCLIPYLPWMRETALLSGQFLGLKYVLPVAIISNAIRVIILSSFMF